MKRVLKTIWLVIKFPLGVIGAIILLLGAGALLARILASIGQLIAPLLPAECLGGPLPNVYFFILLGVMGVASAVVLLIGVVNVGFFIKEKWDEAGTD